MATLRLAKAEHIPESTMARKFTEEWLEQYRIEKAIELYVNEKGSLKEISEITGVKVRMTMRTLRKKSVPLRMGEEVFDIGMEGARRLSRVLGGGCGLGENTRIFRQFPQQVFERSISNREEV